MTRTSHSKLVIGISGAHPHTKSVRVMMRQFRDEGATVVYLTSHVKNVAVDVKRDMAWIDGLIVMGNDLDIDPKCYINRYPQDDPRRCIHPKTKSELSVPHGKVRARYEEAMLENAFACSMPVLGICGGMHRINVLCGGTLHQHIPDLVGCDKHMQHKLGIAPHIPVVPVVIKDNTMLAEIAGEISMPFFKKDDTPCAKVIMENSMHHQAVDIVGSGLRVCAVTDTIRFSSCRYGFMAQAIESAPEGKYEKQFILGVQWHPEFGASSLGERIVQHFIRATHEFVKKRQKPRHSLSFKAVCSIHSSKI